VRKLPSWAWLRIHTALYSFFQTMADLIKPASVQLNDQILGYQESAIVYGIARHRLADMRPGTTCGEIAKARKLDALTCCRLMRAAASIGLFKSSRAFLPKTRLSPGEESSLSNTDDDYFFTQQRFWTTSTGELLRTSHRELAIALNAENKEAWYAAMDGSMQNGRSGFEIRYGNVKDARDWRLRRDIERERWIQASSYLNAPSIASFLADFRFRGTETVCDIGGGRGDLLRAIGEHWPELNLMLLIDQADGSAGHSLAVDHLAARIGKARFAALTSSLLSLLPVALNACDIFILHRVLSTLPDNQAISLLTHIRQVALKPGARLIILDTLLEDQKASSSFASKGNKAALAAFSRYPTQLQDIDTLATAPAGARHRDLSHLLRLFHDARYNTTHLLSLQPSRSDLTTIISIPLQPPYSSSS